MKRWYAESSGLGSVVRSDQNRKETEEMEQLLREALARLERIETGLAKPLSEYLDTESAAAFTSISAVQLAEWRSRGGGPRYIKIGRKVLYAVRDLREYVDSFGKEALS
jgi:hypothetical protein